MNFSDTGQATGVTVEAQSATINLTVNDPPTATDQPVSTRENQAVAITLTGSDPEGSALTFSIATQPQSGTLTGDPPNVTYTPNAGFVGQDSFTFFANDGTQNSAQPGTITINVVDNIAPTADNDTATTAFQTAVTINVLDGDSNGGDGGDLTITAVTQPANGTAAISNNMVVYTPNAGFSGDDTFMYTISDGIDTATATVTVTVQPLPPNIPPTADNDTATTAFETAVTINVLDGDSNGGDGGDLTITEVTQPANGTAVISNNMVVYTPNADFSGDDTFMYTISDGIDTATATVTVTVEAGSDNPPVAVDDVADVAEGVPDVIHVLANDSDPDVGNTLTVISVTQPANGTVEIAGDGQTVTYTSNANFTGTDSFMYTVSDGTGNTATATVMVIVQPATANSGPNTPDPTIALMVDATTGETALIQVGVTASASEDANVTNVMVEIGGISGDTARGEMITINIVNDANNDGVADVDAGEEVLASNTLNNVDVNNILSLALDPALNVPQGTTVNLLVTVEVTPTTMAALVSPQLPIPSSRLGWLALLPSVVGLMVFRRLRRRCPRLYMALAIGLMAGSLFLTSCNNDDDDGGSAPVTFTAAVPANGITGAGATTGEAFATPVDAITGPTVTVTP